MKFKKGDEVRCVKNIGNLEYLVGAQGIVKVGFNHPRYGHSYTLDLFPHIMFHEPELELIEERKNMSKASLTQRVRNAFRSKEDKALIEGGFMYESGSLTKEGRKVVTNLVLQNDKELKAKLVEAALAIAGDS